MMTRGRRIELPERDKARQVSHISLLAGPRCGLGFPKKWLAGSFDQEAIDSRAVIDRPFPRCFCSLSHSPARPSFALSASLNNHQPQTHLVNSAVARLRLLAHYGKG